MTVTFVYGKMGSGKTLYAAIKAWLAYYSKQIIIGNLHLNLKNSYYVTVKDMLMSLSKDTSNDIGKAILNTNYPKLLILDEVHTQMDSRTPMNAINRYLYMFISQCRKRHIDVIYTSQIDNGADRRLRQVTDYITWAIATRKPNAIEPEQLEYYTKEIQAFDTGKFNYFKLLPAQFRYFYNCYDTEEIIEPADPVPVEYLV